MNEISRNTLDQYDYHAWANERLIAHFKSFPNVVYHKKVQSVFPTLSTALIHVYFTEIIWLKVMYGEKFFDIDEFVNHERLTYVYAKKDIEEAEEIFQELKMKYRVFLKKTSDLTKLMHIKHPKFGEITQFLFTNFFNI